MSFKKFLFGWHSRNTHVTTLLILVVKKEAKGPISIRSGSIGEAALVITHDNLFLAVPHRNLSAATKHAFLRSGGSGRGAK